MIKAGLGILGWAPNQFWGATPREFNLSMKGWMEKNGNTETDSSITKEHVNELAARYPDDPKD